MIKYLNNNVDTKYQLLLYQQNNSFYKANRKTELLKYVLLICKYFRNIKKLLLNTDIKEFPVIQKCDK